MSMLTRARAHPHSRGENRRVPGRGGRAGGSSPLTRGKRVDGVADVCRVGLIPTHAGKTNRASGRFAVRRAHPHSRGENVSGPRWGLYGGGSSPLTRGKRYADVWATLTVRLIPTHAGKTAVFPPPRRSPRAHPHSRGENRHWVGSRTRREGSSPLTRGKRGLSFRWWGWVGLIPTHAGKTRDAARQSPPPTAHPHSRGENWEPMRAARVGTGSSPLTRGKPGVRFATSGAWGLIPTHAGKTIERGIRARIARAHPHSRGENMKKADAEALKQGSSPLTRGKRPRHPRPLPELRLIPTHAGKTRACGSSSSR